MNFTSLAGKLLKPRTYPNFHSVSFPAYFISIAVVVVSLIAYLFGGNRMEYFLRITVLISMGFSALVGLLHWANTDTAKWTCVFSLIAQIFLLAALWNTSELLYLMAIPIILAAVLINTPAAVIAAASESIILSAGLPLIPNLIISPNQQLILQICIWCTALVMVGVFLFLESLFAQSASDYRRLQELLESSREQQQRLAQTLEDLEHSNRQLSLLYDKNISLRKTAEEANEAKNNYIARVSHEIRTPLSMILGITENIIENEDVYADEVPLDLMDDIHVVRRNSEHLLSLVNDVLDLTHAEINQLILHKEWVQLSDEIEKSVEIVSPLAQKKKLRLHVGTLPVLPEVYCDRTRIRQVILNLLTNAIRYTDQGEISVSAALDEHSISVCIQDTGLGIMPEDAERIFEPFYRGGQRLLSETTGSGLGLSVCRQFMELHGGKIWVESEVGKGSSFSISLPLTNSEPSARPAASFVNPQWVWVERRRGRTGSFARQPRRHVVVCTEADTLFDQVKQLDPQSDYTLVKDVPELVGKVETAPAHFILFNTPSMDRLLAQMEAAAKVIQDTPLLGTTFTSLQEQVRLTGVAGYVQKPFSAAGLRQVLSTIVTSPRQILIVDDNIDVQKLIVRVLNAEPNFDSTQYLLASTGKDALKTIHTRRPDLILLDLALPDMSGWDIITQLKIDPAACDTPVVIVSAHDINSTPIRSNAVVLMRGPGFSINEFMIQALGQVTTSSQH